MKPGEACTWGLEGVSKYVLSKNKAKTAEAIMAKWTKIFAIVFFLLVIVANVIAIAMK